MKEPIKYSLLITVLVLLFTFGAKAQITVTVQGDWNFSLSTADIIEAGKDFRHIRKSDKEQVKIDVTQSNFWWNLFYNYNWRIDIEKSDVDWDPSLKIFAKRTGDGSPYGWGGNINGGTSWLRIKNFSKRFFRGNRSRTDIPIRYKIKGISVLLPAKTYTTTIVYTVTEL